MLTKVERKIRIKRIIEEKQVIHHTKLLEAIKAHDGTAKKTAEGTIKQLIDDHEITVTQTRDLHRKTRSVIA